MYFIEKESELIGKEIAFTHFAQFADGMVIVTKDKGIFVVNKYDDEIEIYRPHQARKHIFDSKYLRKTLNELGIITYEEIEQYKKELEEKFKRDQEIFNQQQEEREYKEYLRLQEKYGNKNSENKDKQEGQ